jgi:hypothetical protein
MDQDRRVTARFSPPGNITVSPTTASFSMPFGGPATPASRTATVSHDGGGGRAVFLDDLVTTYSPSGVPAWLNANMSSMVIDSLSPQTLTLSVNSGAYDLPIGVYTATVIIRDFYNFQTVDVTLTVVGPNPVISNVSSQILAINDTVSCGHMSPPGTLFRFAFDYTDSGGDVNQSTAVLIVDYQFDSGPIGQFRQPPEPGMSVTGDGFSGQIRSLICSQFGSASQITEWFTLLDSQANPSNTISIVVPKPGGANAPPAASGATGTGEPVPSRAGGAVVSGGSGG